MNNPITDQDTLRPEASSEELALLFHRIMKLMARAHHHGRHAHHAQERLLDLLQERGPTNQRELLELLDVRSSSLSELLRKLERNGLVRRERSEEDRRGYIVTAVNPAPASSREPGLKQIPDPGQDLPADREPRGDENADRAGGRPFRQGGRGRGVLFDRLAQDERSQLAAILEKLIASLDEDPACDAAPWGHGPGKGDRGRGGHGGPGRGKHEGEGYGGHGGGRGSRHDGRGRGRGGRGGRGGDGEF